MITFRSGCQRHQAALVNFFDHGDLTSQTDAALGHLDRCRRCRSEMESTTLTITALRRLGEEIDPVEPSDQVWQALLAGIQRSRHDPWRWRATVTASVMSAAIIAVIGLPVAFGRPSGALGPLSAQEPLGAPLIRQADAIGPDSPPPPRRVTAKVVTAVSGSDARTTIAGWPASGPSRVPRDGHPAPHEQPAEVGPPPTESTATQSSSTITESRPRQSAPAQHLDVI